MTAARIAIIKLSSIGDCVLASAVPRALKQANPQCEITWVVERRCAEIVEANPFVDEVIIAPGARFSALREAGREVRQRRFEVVLDLQGVMKSSVIVAMSRSPRRITGSFARSLAQRAATEVVECGRGHAAELYLRCARTAGADTSDARLVAPVTDEDRAFADEFITRHSPLTAHHSPVVGLNPGASREDKRWPPQRFATVADALSADGARVILFGSPSDRAIGNAVKTAMRQPPIDAVGRTTLRQLAALAERCALFITNDTGPMHLAAAAGAQVVGIFGASDPHFTGPFGDGHVVFWKADSLTNAKRRGVECLARVTAEEVIAACREARPKKATRGYASRAAVAV